MKDYEILVRGENNALKSFIHCALQDMLLGRYFEEDDVYEACDAHGRSKGA
jgi:hypothetical protein